MLYIHIPYCRRKCLYCDFFSGGAKIADWHKLTDALLKELEERVEELPEVIPSVYFGGGTPSLMPAENFLRLSSGIKAILREAGKLLAEDCEITLEVNPEDVNPRNIAAWKEGGVNRVSVGIQTFQDPLLRFLGRTHDGEKAVTALEMLTRDFKNVSGDLIFGLPGQTETMVRDDLECLIDSGVKHISVYSLMYEEGTALTVLRDRGRVGEIPEEIVESEYRLITSILHKAGFIHYEVSNYALPGYRSRHNSGYWKKWPYLGIGPAAHSFDGKAVRRANPHDIKGYLERFSQVPGNGHGRFYTEEFLSVDERREETLMLALRTSEGLDLDAYANCYGIEERQRVVDIARGLNSVSETKIEMNGDRICVNQDFMMQLDTIIVQLL